MNDSPSIEELVPHAAPMLALEELVEWREGFARVRMVIREDEQFLRDGRLDTIVTLEYMAQAVAASKVTESGSLRSLRFRSTQTQVTRKNRDGQPGQPSVRVLAPNGFASAFKSVGDNRVLIDERRFFEIIEEQNAA